MFKHYEKSYFIYSELLILSIGFLISVYISIYPNNARLLENIIYDSFIRLGAKNTEENRIAIIDIDEKSIQEIGQWPWPRSTVADIIEKLLIQQHASAVGLDIIFNKYGDAPGDARLNALSQVAPVTFAYVLDYTPRSPLLQSGVLPSNAGKNASNDPSAYATAYGYIGNHSGLTDIKCAGNIGYIPDNDGVIRRIPSKTFFNGKEYPTLSEAMLNCAGVEFKAPSGPGGLWRLPFKKSIDSLIYISASDVLHERIPADYLKEKYILVGSSALSLGDLISTPISPLAPGLTVHAEALISLLDMQNKSLPQPKQSFLTSIAWIIFSFITIFFTVNYLSPVLNVFYILFLTASWLIISFHNLINQQIEHSLTAPFFGYTIIILFLLPFKWWISVKNGHHLRKQFSSYVGTSVLNEIISNNLEKPLEPSLKDITVLVIDMQNYSRMVNNLSLEESAITTRDFLKTITKPIIDNKGTLDKYMGDGLVAFWGAPLACDNQSDLAVTSAKEIIESLNTLNIERAKNGKKPIQVRIGIESGKAIVGDLGTEFRSTYTAIGDCINFASRLESLAKKLGEILLIGPTAQKSISRFDTVSLGMHSLRDTEVLLEVFTVRDFSINP